MKIDFQNLKRLHEEFEIELGDIIKDVVKSGHFLNGPRVDIFENSFASYLNQNSTRANVKATAVGSGLDALEILLRAAGIQKGDEVIVPAHTFIATWISVLKIGAIPVSIDCRSDTYNIDPEKVKAAVNAKTKAIIAVHLYGSCSDMNALSQIANENGLLLFEDAAQAHGAFYQNNAVGTLSDGAAWSFYPAKNLGALSDAGAITSSNVEIINNAKRLRNYGFSEKYKASQLAYNSRMDELQAAVLTFKLQKLDAWNEQRRKFAKLYISSLKEIPDLVLPKLNEKDKQVWHQFVIRTAKREKLKNYLEKNGISTQIHYPLAIHQQAASQGAIIKYANLTLCEEFANTILSLPVSPEHSLDEIQEIIITLKHFFNHGVSNA